MYFPRLCLLIVFQCSVVLGFTCNSLPCARARSLHAACGPGKIPTVLYIRRVEQRHDYEQDASPVIAADAATYGCNGHPDYAWNSADNEGHIGMDEYRGSIRQWVRRAEEGQWGPMQIMAPILAGLGVALCFAGIYLYWYRKNALKEHRVVLPSGVRGTRRFFGLFPSISYVRESNRSNTWTIEPRDDLENSSHGHGHTRLPSSPSNEAVVTQKPRSRFLEALKAAIPTPWKRKPVTVQSIPARKGFRIDDIDRRTSTTPSRPSIAMTLDDEHAPGEHPWKYLPQPQASSNGSRSGTENLFPGDDPGNDSDDDGENTEHEEEHTSLLSASSRMGHNIMLISRNGEDFTLESGDSQRGSRQHHGPSLNIVPPSPAMARPDPSKQPLNQPVLPPVPSYPAPQPSSTPRPIHRAALSPLQEATTLSPPPSIRPSPSNHSLASHHLDQASQHTGAHSLSPPYTPRIQGGSLRRTEHVRRPSFETEAEDGAVLRPSAERVGWAMNNSLSSPHLPLPLHPPQSVRRTPSPDHRRILSAEDSSHNHPYALSVPGPSAHLRSSSADHIARPSTTDPDMLFPGSVRAAGYTPWISNLSNNASTESMYSQGSFPLPPGVTRWGE